MIPLKSRAFKLHESKSATGSDFAMSACKTLDFGKFSGREAVRV